MTVRLVPALLFLLWLVVAPAPAARAHPGVGILCNARGDIFYTDLTHVWRIARGSTKAEIAVRDVHTHELCFDVTGSLLGEHLWYNGEAANTWSHRVWRLAPDGTLSDVIPARAGFRTEVSFVRDRAGNQFFHERTADHRDIFRRRNPDSTTTTLLETRSLHDVRWFFASPGGTLYFIDQSDLWRLSPGGRPKLLARRLSESDAPDQRHHVQGLFADGTGHVWVAVHELRAVKKISPDGTVTTVARSSAPWAPSGVLAMADGGLWLLECTLTNQVRVRHLAADGTEQIY